MKKILLVVAALLFVVFASQAQSKTSSAANSNKPETIQIKTSAVCNMCKNTIEKDLSFEKGVKSAVLDVPTQMLTVSYFPKKTSPDKIRKAVSKTGYDADDVPAEEKTYEKLDECCKKTNEVHH
jgi:periplasmic mercuric ion binding protein